MMKLAFLASGRGTNMQAIIDACLKQELDATPVLVVSNNREAEVLDRARSAGVQALHIGGEAYSDASRRDAAITRALQASGADLVVLAGYMKKIGSLTLAAYKNRIINIHPALLPRHGGQGMYGRAIHEAVLAAGDKETGVSIHIVDAEYDTGPVLAQQVVAVKQGDTVDSLAQRVLAIEHTLYVDTLKKIATGEISLPDEG